MLDVSLLSRFEPRLVARCKRLATPDLTERTDGERVDRVVFGKMSTLKFEERREDEKEALKERP